MRSSVNAGVLTTVIRLPYVKDLPGTMAAYVDGQFTCLDLLTHCRTRQGTVRKNQQKYECNIGCRCVNVRLGCIYNNKWLAGCSAADETSDSFLVEGQTFADAGTIDSGAGVDGAAPADKA